MWLFKKSAKNLIEYIFYDMYKIWQLIKKLLGITMNVEEIKEKYKDKSFQWTKGEHIGTVEKLVDAVNEEGIIFLTFNSGRRMNLSFLSEFMDISNNPNLTNDITTTLGKGNPVPQKQIDQPKQSNIITPVQAQLSEDPVTMILNQQTPNMVNIELNLKLNIPTKDLYNVLSASFPNSDEAIINWITNNIDIADIKKGIEEMIQDYYKPEVYRKTTKRSGKSVSTK